MDRSFLSVLLIPHGSMESTSVRFLTILKLTYTPACTFRLLICLPVWHCTRAFSVFGSVTGGLDVIDKIEGVGSQSGKTAQKVVIKDCGEV